MDNLSGLEQHFVNECKPFVKAIEEYSGNDPIEPWYNYLLWIEERYEVHMDKTVFGPILRAFLEQYQYKTEFHQDRRFIKGFFYYIAVEDQDLQNGHYQIMYDTGVGTKVAEFYMNWAFLFDKEDDFGNAERIYQLGLLAGAEPLAVLRADRNNFLASKNRRLDNNQTMFWKRNEKILKMRLDTLITFRLSDKYVPVRKSTALYAFNTAKLRQYCVPRLEEPIEQVPPTPRSSVRDFVDSSRKRKSLNVRRLQFEDVPKCFESIPLPPEQNMFQKGFQWDGIIDYHPNNIKQRIVDIEPYIYDNGDLVAENLEPAFDTVLLLPAPDKAFSQDELRAYRWFKKNKIENEFTKQQDQYWSNAHESHFRRHVTFESKNLPQPKWNISAIGNDENYYISDKPYRWAYNYQMHYPEHSSEELSLDEIVWQKRMKAPQKTTAMDMEGQLSAGHITNFNLSTICEDLTLPLQEVNEENHKLQAKTFENNNRIPLNDENKPFNLVQPQKVERKAGAKNDIETERRNTVNVPDISNFNYEMEDTVDFEQQEARCFSPLYLQERTLIINASANRPSLQSSSRDSSVEVKDFSKLGHSIILRDNERKLIVQNRDVRNERQAAGAMDQTVNLMEVRNVTEKMEVNCAESMDVSISFDCKEDAEVDDIGKSIYVPPEELVFDEADADWAEVTQFLANETAKNEYQPEEVDLNETTQKLDTFMLNFKDMSPFDAEFQKTLLERIGFVDKMSIDGDYCCDMVNIVQPLKPKVTITVNGHKFKIQKMIGSGSFGKVFSAECLTNKEYFAFKQQRPPNLWEYYVCFEVQKRIQNSLIREGFMAIDYAIVGNNSTVYISKYAKYGTLLNVCNKVKMATNKSIDEVIVMLIVKQMFTLISNLHAAKIIHADLKPDNFLMMDKLSSPQQSPKMAIQLIDFGQSIDLKQFPSKQVFWHKVKTENFICTEMMDDRPWSYQFDLFCLASTIYTMVAGKYMVVARCRPSDPYKPQKLPRYVNATMWNQIFDTLINVPNPKIMPNLSDLEQLIDDQLQVIGSKKINDAIAIFNKALD